MAIEGPLTELRIEDVLQLMELARKTGVLTVRSERLRDEVLVHFDRGVIVFAVRRGSARLLGQQLLRAGRVTERELERALELQREYPMRRLGEILLEMGSLTEDELLEHLRFQVEETIYDVMGWGEGYFRFEETPSLPEARVAVRVRVESLLMEGARRIDEWARLEPRIPSLAAIPVLAGAHDPDASPPLELRPEEWELLAEIDGEKDLRRLAAELGRSAFDVARVVYGLVNMGIVAVEDRPVRLAASELEVAVRDVERLLAERDFDTAARRAEELHAAHPDRPDLNLLAGRALAAQGRLRAAAEAFARAVTLDPLAAEAHYRLGFAAARLGEFGRAAQAWESYLHLAGSGAESDRVRKVLGALRSLDFLLAEGTPAP